MPTALSNGHSHSKSKQYLERQPVSRLAPTSSWFQIQWPFLYHPCWGTVVSYCPHHSVFSLVSMTSSSSLLAFCWSSKCWDAPDLRTRPLSHLVHILLLFVNMGQWALIYQHVIWSPWTALISHLKEFKTCKHPTKASGPPGYKTLPSNDSNQLQSVNI